MNSQITSRLYSWINRHFRHAFHDDVIKWKPFPRYWTFVRGIHRWPVNSPPKGQWRGALLFSLICLNKRLSKQSWGWWFETPSRSLWRHCNVISSLSKQPQGPVLWRVFFLNNTSYILSAVNHLPNDNRCKQLITWHDFYCNVVDRGCRIKLPQEAI